MPPQQSPKQVKVEAIIRPPRENDLAEADRLCRLAHGTFLDLTEPTTAFGDAEYLRTRWLADPKAALR